MRVKPRRGGQAVQLAAGVSSATHSASSRDAAACSPMVLLPSSLGAVEGLQQGGAGQGGWGGMASGVVGWAPLAPVMGRGCQERQGPR